MMQRTYSIVESPEMLIIDEEGALEVIRLIGGEEATRIAQKLIKKPALSDEELASTLGIDVKEVRRILHQLNDLSLVNYELAFDKKANKRIFRWHLRPEQVVSVATIQLKKIAERLRMLKEYISTNQFYWCGNNRCRKYPFAEALDKLFTCPTCGGKLNHYDASLLLSQIEEKLEEIEKALR